MTKLYKNIFLLIIFSFIAFLYIGINSINNLSGLFSDSVNYLFLADYFSFYQDNTFWSEYFFKTSVHPPFYPVILSIVGAGSNAITLAHSITAVFLVLGIILFYFWLEQQKLYWGWAIFLTVCLAATYGIFLHSLLIASEYLYFLLIFLVFISYSQAKNNWKLYILMILFVSFAILTRSIGIVLLPALFILFLKNPKRLLLLVFPIIVVVLWKFIQNHSDGGYLVLLKENFSGLSFIEIMHKIFLQIQNIYSEWILLFAPEQNFAIQITTTLLLIIALLAFVKRLLQLELDALYVFFYLIIIAIWPYPDEGNRFLLMIYPFILFYALTSAQCLYNLLHKKFFIYIIMLIIIISIVPGSFFITKRLLAANTVSETLFPYTRTIFWFTGKKPLAQIQTMQAIIEANQDIAKKVPKNQCIYSTYAHLSILYSRRDIIETPKHLETKENPLQYLQKCQYILIFSLISKQNDVEPYYPFNIIKNYSRPVQFYYAENSKDPAIILAIFER